MSLQNKWYWLSFADGSLPPGTQFLGGVLLQTDTDPIIASHVAGLNPGGEVLFGEVPHQEMVDAVPDNMRNVLLNKDDAQSASDMMSAAYLKLNGGLQ